MILANQNPREGEQGILKTFVAAMKDTSTWLSFPDQYSTTNHKKIYFTVDTI